MLPNTLIVQHEPTLSPCTDIQRLTREKTDDETDQPDCEDTHCTIPHIGQSVELGHARTKTSRARHLLYHHG